MDKQPEALRLADWHKAMADEPKRNEAKRDKHRRTAAALRRLYAENRGQAERIQDLYKQLDDTEKEADDLLAELHEEAKINGASAERELKLMAELDKVKAITLRNEVLLRIAYLAIDKMLPTAFCAEGVEALKQLKERLNVPN